VSPAALEWLAGIVAIAVALGLVTALLELIWMASSGRLNRAAWREMGLSLSPLVPNAAFTLVTSGIWAALYVSAHQRAWLEIPTTLLSAMAALVVVDFSYYWEHRVAHRLPLLWRLYHAAHHSSASYTVATAYRVSFLSQLLAPAFYLPWVWLGFHPLLILALQLFAFHWQAWLHTEWIGPLGWVDRWFNTPASHRIHHSTAPEHRDRNLGAISLVWDRLFGTHALPAENLSYGIADQPAPKGILDIYLDPWRHRH
jgi:sterol desaturase/sphingolipid hydroxylase (fatty acid hydroxylase superfamily)